MPVTEMNTKKVLPTRRFLPVIADSSQELPSRIEIMRAGEWPDDSNKGHMVITTADLLEFKSNFDKGVGMPGGQGFGLPIDFAHEEWGKAAGWIKSLEVDGEVMYAAVEWSGAGIEALKNGEFKCISPSFYPSCLGSWHDPEDWSVTAQNVLVGAGLTNIPFFKDLKPLMASRNNDDGRNVIYVQASEDKGKETMTLDEVLAKDAASLSDEERNMLVEANNEGKLTADQQTKFGFEVKADKTDDNKNNEGKPVSASTTPTDGKIDAAAFNKLQATVEEQGKVIADQGKVIAEYRQRDVEAFVDAQLKRGAIKADQRDEWVKKIMADESLKPLLENAPADPVAAAAKGKENPGEAVTAAEEVRKKAQDLVKAAKEAGQNLLISDAYSKVMADDKELAQRYENEVKGVN